MPTTIESLELEVKQNGNSAVQGIDALSASLTRLKSATKGGMGLTSVATQIRNLNTALTSTDTSKIDKLASSLEKLKSLGGLKISSSIASQLKNIGSAASSLTGVDFSGISQMSNAVSSLGGITKSAGLQSAITQLGKIPELAKTLNGVNWAQFTSQMQSLTNSLAPLASQLNTVSVAFTRLPSNVRQLVQNTNSLATANNNASKSYINLYAKLRMAITAVRSAARTIASWITQSNKYVEDLNLFTVSLGEYADSAKEYAEKVSELVGIDPADWLRNQGVFNTIIKGFGVASDKAIIMSKNLTQLGYDISSFYNISTEDAFTKLQSGIAGELEPLRRLGYDLSVARLQQEAYTLGINKSVSAMTQAEKSQLRYYAIMTQVKDAQGDMARTLNAPANQLRILQAQVTQCARALGNIFIPALNAVLPYAIAVAKVIRLIANAIASLFGFSLPEIDYSGISAGASAVADSAESAEDGFGGAAKAAKKLKDNPVKGWVENSLGGAVSKAVELVKRGWYYVSSWVSNYIGGAVSQGVSLFRSGWYYVSSWVSQYIGGSVSVTVNLLKGWWGSIKNWLGLSDGGTISASGAFKLMADGGIITPNSFWQSIPKYAGGASLHGSMFLAGENGAEMVGHVNGTTEVLNRFQMGQIMHSSIIAGMAQFLPIWRTLNSTLVTSANAIIRSVLVSADVVNSHLATQVTYDPSNFLSQSVYDESESVYRNSRDESTMASTMRDFYREYVEPTLREIATDAKRQADKEEKTIVQIGNRTINDAVVTQQKANGYVFAK